MQSFKDKIVIALAKGAAYVLFDETGVILRLTKHVIGILSKSGCEILIHVGMIRREIFLKANLQGVKV